MPRLLADKVLVITGASSGIGAATAARAGMHLVLHGRDRPRLTDVAQRVRALGRDAELVVGDVTEPSMTARLLDAAQTRFGRFDVVFANAGYGFKKASHELTPQELRQIFEVNFFAALDLVSEAARRLIAGARPGHLLMCSSAVAKFTMPNFAAYSATKAAQNHFCRAMRLELAPHRIDVSSVHPVTTRTEFFNTAARLSGRSPDPRRPHGDAPRAFVQSAEHVAAAVVRCLRRPVPEVWPSRLGLVAAGLMTLFPRFADFVGRRV